LVMQVIEPKASQAFFVAYREHCGEGVKEQADYIPGPHVRV